MAPLGVNHGATSPGWAASGPRGEEPALGGFQGPRGPREVPQTHPSCAPPSRSPLLPAVWAVNPRSQEQVQGPRATLWGLVSIHPSSGLLQGSPDGQCGKGHGCQVWVPLQSPERTVQVGGEGRGGRSGQELQRRPVPCPGGPLVISPRGNSGSGLGPQGAHVHAGQAEPGGRQPLAGAVLVEADAEEEVARAEEQKGPKAG